MLAHVHVYLYVAGLEEERAAFMRETRDIGNLSVWFFR